MSKILTEVLESNQGYAATFTKGDLPLPLRAALPF